MTVLADGGFAVERGPGRDGVTFQTKRLAGHLSVIPADAVEPLAAGRLDPRLFDVTTLLAFGYDDRRADLPLIFTGGSTAVEGAAVDRRLPRLGAVAARQDRREPGTLWRELVGDPQRTVWLDGLREPTLDVSVPQIGAPDAWAAGYRGAGVTVAVLDTGVDDTHPDLAGKVRARANFTEGTEDDLDHDGHGTHVAATIAGRKGVAPESALLDGKVCVADGCAESWILAGMEWTSSADVVNMSLGGYDAPGVDPLEHAVNTLTERYGTLFVVAAGNDGPSDASVNSPASADAALAVGAVDKSGRLADFSGRGPRVGDGAIKPDITAPGVDITAARAGGGYVTMSGTSMATPHVAGAAAILAQQHPDWPPGRLKSALMSSAVPAQDVFAHGAGRVDVAAAVTRTVTAEPVTVHFGEQRWPHTDDEPVSREVTYHNAGTEPVTMNVSVDNLNFAVSPTSVTVAPGGTATVTVTADTRVSGPDGVVTGTLAAGGARTLLSVRKEVESYDVTINRIGRDGGPVEFGPVDLYRVDGPGTYFLFDESTVRLPKGRYNLAAWFLDQHAPEAAMTLMVQPVLDVSADSTVTVDARLARPSAITVPSPAARLEYVHIGYAMMFGDEPAALGQLGTSFETLHTGQIGEAASGFTSNISAQWTDGPDVYQIAHHEPGRLVSGYERAVAATDLATLRVRTSGGDDDGVHGGFYAISRVPGQLGESLLQPNFAPLPATRTWYVNTDGGMEWRAGLYQSWEDPESGDGYLYAPTVGPWTRYRLGVTYHRVWNQAVLGPVLPCPDGPRTGVTRTGDRLRVDLSPYGDGAGRPSREVDAGSTVLYRDGVEVGRGDVAGRAEFTVPATDSAYRLRSTPNAASRTAWPRRSTRRGRSAPVTRPARRRFHCGRCGSRHGWTSTTPPPPAARSRSRSRRPPPRAELWAGRGLCRSRCRTTTARRGRRHR